MVPDLRDEIDFRELLKKPSTLFGYAFPYVLLVLVGLGIYYAHQMTTVGKNSVPPALFADTSASVQDIPLQRPRELPPVDVTKVAQPSDELIAQGQELFSANCSSCHGESGRGDGPAGLQLTPPPRNFHAASGWINGPSVSGIYKTLEEGIAGSGMASYNYLPPIDRFALAHFVRTYVPNPPPPSTAALQQLELTYQLSRGLSVPGQIPVRKAAEILLRQNQPVIESIRRAGAQVRNDPSAGARLLRRSTHDLDRALAAFLARRGPFPTEPEFQTMVLAEPVALGFEARVARFTPQEWALVYDYLAGVRSAAGSQAVRMF
jgi:mono/diheme cytochrome c family protein